MGRITVALAFLFWDFATSEDNGDEMACPEPWNWEAFQQTFFMEEVKTEGEGTELRSHMESCPVQGIRKLDKGCPDLKDILVDAVSRSKWDSFMQYAFEKHKTCAHDDELANQFSTTRNHEHRDALLLYNKWFNTVWARGKGNDIVDQCLREENLMPHQICHKYKWKYPPKLVSK